MSIKKVNTKVDFIAAEHDILDFWEDRDIFEKLRKQNKGKPKWSFIDGPITANNPMGVHHAWGRSLKDIYNRYKAMLGHELRYQNGFDCQGLWVEVEVEKELGFKTKREVEEFGIEKFVSLCKERVIKYSRIQSEQSKRLGYWMDWDNSYYTMSDENNYTIWSFLKKLWSEGKIYRGNDVVPWSGRSGTSYSQMEIIEGRKLVAHKSVFVRFPIKGRENEYLLVWTTTPWTLSSNVVVGVNVNLDYVKLKAHDGSFYYFAKENLEFQRLDKQFKDKKQWVEGVQKLKTIAQMFKERGGYEECGIIKGAEMLGWEYEGPFDDFEAQSEPGGYPIVDENLKEKGITSKKLHQVVDPGKDGIGNDIVVGGEGTGIVHMAPGCGDIDHKVGKKLNLVNIAPLNDESKFIEKFGWLSGKLATDKSTTDAIIKDLKERGFLVHVEDYPHVYPHCWRSGDELVFRLVDEWYINMDWRDKIKKVVNDINWIPEWGEEREHEWLNNMGDWMISKKRFWGLALPIWTFEDDSFYVIGSKEELKELAVEGWEEFDGNSPHRPWIDNVKIKHPETGLIGTRIKDVGNPWLDAGIVPFSTLKYNTDRDYWKDWFPGDFVTECFPGQFRNWFYSMLAMSAELEGVAPFKTLLGHALVKDQTGREMHKSWGNAIWFDDAAEKMGVDVMRWMYALQNVEHNLLFGYDAADEVRKKLITLWNVYSFYATYAAVDGFDPEKFPLEKASLTILDRWILAKLHLLIQDGRNSLDEYRVDGFMKSFEIFMEDLSNWYIRRNRRRFWKSEDDNDKNTAYATLYHVLTNVIRITAPVLPFVSESIYQNLVINSENGMPESVHLCSYPEADKTWIDHDLIQNVDALKTLVELGRSARNQSNQKIRQPLSKALFAVENDSVAKFVENNKEIILDELNVKKIERITESDQLISYKIKPNLRTLGQKYGKGLAEIRGILESLNASDLVTEIQKSNLIELENGKYKLTREDIFIETEAEEGFAAASQGGITVGLSLELTEDLLLEGIVRDIVRSVQNMRKDAGFAVEDRITISWDLDGQFAEAIRKFDSYFKTETLTNTIIDTLEKPDYSGTIELKNKSYSIHLKKA
ncbi:MAG: isoleucine--tRNA ligase [Candidatus Marinimicrobia bacterium]|jgi:isoleucyl-tRNA synthetase|nr:isoleucine--tRNA ligase [Candidatus Neomarinimicrobiota bacterium]MBT3501171.1 isoleucine--tRNA ligase [Candidatus Neomarinimicrobiota bacterium]MBT3839733.1 isoleucine--tRNA ligase [Candidatus Neomarinimicrobiota bacterium]MBT3999491.1 isoleucine--tRNA ligase [Candidatus Neomarinimicrobiota bacterium]MBT4282960.1 isoleucine--tRNA ligase [Candidatus Neomarinimicrobiota bacterium]